MKSSRFSFSIIQKKPSLQFVRQRMQGAIARISAGNTEAMETENAHDPRVNG